MLTKGNLSSLPYQNLFLRKVMRLLKEWFHPCRSMVYTKKSKLSYFCAAVNNAEVKNVLLLELFEIALCISILIKLIVFVQMIQIVQNQC